MTNDNSRIEWTDATWNPVTGCSKVSDGCRFCYAEAVSHRWGHTSKPWTYPHAAENVVLHPDRLDQPLRWRKPRRIFVNSMSDLFHEQVPDDFIDQVFGVMAAAPQHTFQILTKRPDRMHRYLVDEQMKHRIWKAGRLILGIATSRDMYDVCPVARPGEGPEWCYPAQWPLPNVWIGTSVEDQRVADERIGALVQVPAIIRFLSCEPLIGPLSLDAWFWLSGPSTAGPWRDALGRYRGGGGVGGQMISSRPSGDLHWVIVGGESGPNHRPIDPDWVRSLRDECVAADVPFFFKQWGGRTPKAGGRELDGRTWDEMPAVEMAVAP